MVKRPFLKHSLTPLVQVYAASRGQEPPKLYKVRYGGSYEQDRFVASLKSENAT